MSMSKDAIALCVKQQDLLDNPELLSRLYLHHRRFSEIKNLDAFLNVKVLFLEANQLTKIENLHNLKHLEVLHLEKNKIVAIQNLRNLTKLKYLNLGQNEISKIEGLDSLHCLQTLILRQNDISMTDFITSICSLPNLREIDLSLNKINCDPQSILDILTKCSSLRILCLQGNPFVKKMLHYRSMIISHCKNILSLDGKRICSEERRRCNVFGKIIMDGGTFDEAKEADRQELLQIRLERSQRNAELRKRLQSQRSNNSDRSRSSRSVLDGVRRTFGLLDSRAFSSDTIDSSTCQYRSINLNNDAWEEVAKKSNYADTDSLSAQWSQVDVNSPRGID